MIILACVCSQSSGNILKGLFVLGGKSFQCRAYSILRIPVRLVNLSGGSRTSDKWGPRSSRPWNKRGAALENNFSRPCGPLFGLKIRWGPPLDPPLNLELDDNLLNPSTPPSGLIGQCNSISHVQNEQGTGYEYSISIALKNWARHLKEHPKISYSTKFESYWFKRIGIVHF